MHSAKRRRPSVPTFAKPSLEVLETRCLLSADIVPMLSQQSGNSKGFYTTSRGEAALTGTTTGSTLSAGLVNSLVGTLANPNLPGYLVLVDANGNYEPTSFLQSYSNVQSYLHNENPSNMAYALSAELLTTEINVYFNYVDPTTSISVPAVTFAGQSLSTTLQNSLTTNGVSTSSGAANIQTMLNASIAELINHPYTAAASSDRVFEEALKDCFTGINTNEDIFIV